MYIDASYFVIILCSAVLVSLETDARGILLYIYILQVFYLPSVWFTLVFLLLFSILYISTLPSRRTEQLCFFHACRRLTRTYITTEKSRTQSYIQVRAINTRKTYLYYIYIYHTTTTVHAHYTTETHAK